MISASKREIRTSDAASLSPVAGRPQAIVVVLHTP